MPDYKNGKIYCIRSYQTEQIYIGSTTQTLAQRLVKHKGKNDGCSSKIILQYSDAYIELIELFPCNSKEELNKKEGEHIRANNCVNKNISGRTLQEWYNDNKEKIAEQKHQYRKINKEKIKEYNKKYKTVNKEILKQKRKLSKE